MSGVVFEDIFHISRLNPHGKKFDRVNRLECKGVTYEMDLLLDINCEIYKVSENDRINVSLATTLDPAGAPDDGTYRPLGDEPTLADRFDYVMHGRIFKYEYQGEKQVSVLASFGGLLMKLTGDQRHLANLKLDSRIYCLIKQLARGS